MLFTQTPDSADAYDAPKVRALATAALLREPPPLSCGTDRTVPPPSDFDLNPDAVAELGPALAHRPAAVLVPIVAHTRPSLLFTQRTAHLAAHPGQISFPGGKIDETDADAIATAVREAEEEIGLSASHIEPIGFLDAYRTGTGFRITPVVAMVTPGFSLRLNASEVAEAFEVPLAFFLQAQNYRTDTRTIGGKSRSYYAIPYGERYIWGATAGILNNMRLRFTGS